MAYIIGAVIGMFIMSSLVAVIAFRKVEKPKKQLYSIPIAWVLATILAGYGMANGGAPKFLEPAINYGIASIILLAIHLAVYYFQKSRAANKTEDEPEEPKEPEEEG